MNADVLLNAYIDLNILLLAGTLLWFAARKALARSPLGRAYRPQLRLLNGMTVLLAASPLLILAFTRFVIAHPPNFSDMLVSQYLQGNVSMSAGTFEATLGLREDAVRGLTSLQPGWAQAVAAAFAVGALICLAHVAASVFRLRQNLAGSFLWKRIGRVQLMVSDDIRVAYSTRGLLRRYVVLPSALLNDPRDLRLTIAHELQHFRQRDIECEFLLELLRPALFWNPAFYLWRREVRLLREFACDQALMARPAFDVRAYCECLIRACALAARGPALFTRRSPAVALVDRRETRRGASLQRRIIAVTAVQPRGPNSLGWGLVSLTMAGVVLATAVLLQRPSDWSHDRIMLSTIVNLERMASRNSTPELAVSALNGGFAVPSQ
ncbi:MULTISPECIES: M56 family metallopeptidase [unclassified Leisingera]|uniref:M56 family metallopeptidase n=1 Tax=unclassified Leisingera TaxID=2614906 RepID=UPI00031AB6CB|nr:MULTISPECIES: M56 family metallopeptidase [unclassified Leisingera]KIC15544.1 peptidase M56, BlaR1 [Leisingera sp. ANG-DT]KIC23347.1 peptidase M56, BlaR1 [Leisingera sp. ANG-S3]KIC34092.1 peptidase M56, BlaR1 [Leisingera sp. ANG-S5]KIC54850.1 peptidase M56, BlaR1 [Leisingera sp. ANG-S]KID08547.1 peptidase M56, BlaR1 [Leisingera sp. ANG1]